VGVVMLAAAVLADLGQARAYLLQLELTTQLPLVAVAQEETTIPQPEQVVVIPYSAPSHLTVVVAVARLVSLTVRMALLVARVAAVEQKMIPALALAELEIRQALLLLKEAMVETRLLVLQRGLVEVVALAQ
jgi:hypothetical protein